MRLLQTFMAYSRIRSVTSCGTNENDLFFLATLRSEDDRNLILPSNKIFSMKADFNSEEELWASYQQM